MLPKKPTIVLKFYAGEDQDVLITFAFIVTNENDEKQSFLQDLRDVQKIEMQIKTITGESKGYLSTEAQSIVIVNAESGQILLRFSKELLGNLSNDLHLYDLQATTTSGAETKLKGVIVVENDLTV